MTEINGINKAGPGIGFRIFRGYLRWVHDHLYYRRVYWLGKENIPERCPLMIVSDHQNGLADVLGAIFSITDRRRQRKLRVIARASVFRPVFVKALDWLGILPAFRMSFDGEQALANNNDTFERAEQELLANGTVVIYAEGIHQDKHWLGKFTSGYLHIAFEAAEKSGFKKDIFILPSCNHYSDYFGLREQMLISYGTPVSIAPYYELYKEKPRTAQRQVNALVWQQVSDMMLNITDLDNYDAIDFLRNTYGIGYARHLGLDPDRLPEKLQADKDFFAKLDTLKQGDPEVINNIYDRTRVVLEDISRHRIADSDFDKGHNPLRLLAEGAALLFLLPGFIFACVPNLLVWYAPRPLTSKMSAMQHSGVKFAVWAVAAMPLLYLIMFAAAWAATGSWIIALAYFCSLPFLGIFAWRYTKWFSRWVRQWRFRGLRTSGRLDGTAALRKEIHNNLDTLLKQTKKQ